MRQNDIYSVEQVAAMLDVNPETVRRWIRGGKLEAKMENKRHGYSISATDLVVFVGTNVAMTDKFLDILGDGSTF